jgi:hypothetical protein
MKAYGELEGSQEFVLPSFVYFYNSFTWEGPYWPKNLENFCKKCFYNTSTCVWLDCVWNIWVTMTQLVSISKQSIFYTPVDIKYIRSRHCVAFSFEAVLLRREFATIDLPARSCPFPFMTWHTCDRFFPIPNKVFWMPGVPFYKLQNWRIEPKPDIFTALWS